MQDEDVAPDGAISVCETEEKEKKGIYQDYDRVLEIYEEAKGLSPQEIELRMSALTQAHTELVGSGKTHHLLKEQTKIVSNVLSSKEDYTPKKRFTPEMGETGMLHLIKDKGTVQDAYTVVADKHKEPLEEVKKMSKEKMYNCSEILDRVEESAKKEISKLREEKVYNKDGLLKAHSVNQLFKDTYNHMQVLGKIDALCARVEHLEACTLVNSSQIKQIQDACGIIPDPKKLECIAMYHKGYTQKAIAQHLGVGYRTVKRWIKEVKDNSPEYLVHEIE